MNWRDYNRVDSSELSLLNVKCGNITLAVDICF
jgi:hypothetical protein